MRPSVDGAYIRQFLLICLIYVALLSAASDFPLPDVRSLNGPAALPIRRSTLEIKHFCRFCQ